MSRTPGDTIPITIPLGRTKKAAGSRIKSGTTGWEGLDHFLEQHARIRQPFGCDDRASFDQLLALDTALTH